MIELSERATALLMTATRHGYRADKLPLYFIRRAISYDCWATSGQKGGRLDTRELYRKGLIKEWFSPWSPPCFLTIAGLQVFYYLQSQRDEYTPTPEEVQEAQEILDSLVRDGVVWMGPDGRYRLREDVTVVDLDNGETEVRRKPAN